MNNKDTVGHKDINKDTNKDNPNPTDLQNASISEVSLYVVRKTEKIAQALYLLTNYLPLEEPFRRNVREKALELVDELYRLELDRAPRPTALAQLIDSKFSELLAILNVGARAGLMSEMNFMVIEREIDDLKTLAVDKLQVSVSTISDDFFATPLETPKRTLLEKPLNRTDSSAAPDSNMSFTPSDSTTPAAATAAPSSPRSPRPRATTAPARRRQGTVQSKRRHKILTLLSNKDEIDINDVSAAVEGCSQKTLQRELKSLVDENILERKGKRRWSTYVLAPDIKLDQLLTNSQA